MNNITIKFDELVPKAAEMTIKETESDFNHLTPEQNSDVHEFMKNNTDVFLEHYEDVFRKNLHQLVQDSVDEQING